MPTAAPATLEATSDRLHDRESSKSWSISIDAESASASASGARIRSTRDARALTARYAKRPSGAYKVMLMATSQST